MYSCQEHNKNIHEGCVACEVYSDIVTLEEENQELREAISHAQKVLNEQCYNKLANILHNALIGKEK